MPTWTKIVNDPFLIRLLQVAIGLLIIGVVFHFLARTFSRQAKDIELRYRIRKMVSFTGYLFMALLVAVIFSDSIGRITVVFGVVGAGVAFALQEVIVSFAGWVAISLGQFYRTGDRVQLGGIVGDVIDISPLRTTLMECGGWVISDLYNGRIVRIANSFVFKEPVYNYSGDFPFIWDEVKLPIRHGCDHREARRILEEAATETTGQFIEPARKEWLTMTNKYLIENARINPMVTLIITDNWLEFTVRYVVNYKQRRYIKDRLYTAILDGVERSDHRVQLASTTLEIVAVPGSRPLPAPPTTPPFVP